MRDAGFSLVEVLVALAISAVIAIGATILLQQTMSASARVDAAAADNQGLLTAHGLLFDDFASATDYASRPASGYGPWVGFASGGSGAGSLLGFTRSGWLNPNQLEERSDLVRVEYRLEKGNLIRRVWVRPDPLRNTPSADRILLGDVETVGIRFLNKGIWLDNWPASLGGMPDAVEVNIGTGGDRHLSLTYLVGGGA